MGPAGVPSGAYPFRSAAGARFGAYCEMTLAAGGWTLVGQSGAGSTNSFGWSSATGSVTDTTNAYSLDAIGHGLTMTEALLATGTRTAIGAAYVVKVPAGFPGGFATVDAPTGGTTKVQNPTCPTTNAPAMMKKMGHTADTAQFFFRDVGGDYPVGLFPAGWDLYWSDCGNCGGFKSVKGMLFVR